MNYETHDLIPFEWNVGDLILGKYEIRDIFGGGGMGIVYRAYHHEWKIELAIKTPRENFFTTQEQVDSFKSEAENWIRVGMHPNVATCFYVQNLGRSPRIFAEFVEGGSLSDWINTGRFKLSSKLHQARLIIGVAIQFARGLEYAHNKGLIHQDVKPANVLMTPDGSPKVTDFGLANARVPKSAESTLENSSKTVYVQRAGFLTQAYASPEQAAGLPLSRKTDIWSWAVSILEILNGGRDWSHGQAAPFALEFLYEDRIHTDPLACLLSDCFAWNPEDRPSDFSVVIQRLNGIHNRLFGEEFPHQATNLKRLSVDSLNNHAVSLIELGKGLGNGENGLSCLYELRSLDKNHTCGRLNLNLLRWREGFISTRQMTSELESLTAQPESGMYIPHIWIVDYYREAREYKKAIDFLINSNLTHNEQFTRITESLLQFKFYLLNIFNNFERGFRELAIGKFQLIGEEISDAWLESSAREFGIVGYCSEKEEVVICDLHSGRYLLKSTFRHIKAFAISQNGKMLLVLMVDDTNVQIKHRTRHPFLLSLFTLDSGNRVDLPNNFELPNADYCRGYKLIVTDDGRSASIWIPRKNGWTTVDYEYSHDGDEWQCNYDFRKVNAILPGAKIIRTSAYGGHLIATIGSRLQVWVTQQAQINHCILDIDLCDYGIINTRNYLPYFSLQQAWEFEIDQWNIFDVLRAIRRLPKEKSAPYIIVRPPTWGESVKQWHELQDALNEIRVIETTCDARKLVERLDQCLKIGVAIKADLRDKRHSIVRKSNDCYLAGAWLEDSVNQYWDSDIVGVISEFRNLFTFKRYQKLSRIFIGKAEDVIDSSNLSESHFFNTRKDTEYKRCFGLCFLNSNRSLYLMHRGFDDLCCKIALLKEQDSETNHLIAEWDVNLDFNDKSPEGVVNRSEFDWFECINNRIFYRDGLESICIRDVEDGEIISSFSINDQISMIKKVEFNGIEYLAVGTSSMGVVYLFDQNGKSHQILDLNIGRGGFVEDISHFCTDAILMTQNHAWIHVNVLEKSSAIVSSRYWEDQSRNRIHRNQRFRLSRCGKAVVEDDGISVSIIDLKNGVAILNWSPPSPWVLQAPPCFDVSSRWLVMPHSVNRYDIFELFWNI
jgi:serine/threonine protein kinase